MRLAWVVLLLGGCEAYDNILGPDDCGNGVIDPGEDCDGGRGCTSSCEQELPRLTVHWAWSSDREPTLDHPNGYTRAEVIIEALDASGTPTSLSRTTHDFDDGSATFDFAPSDFLTSRRVSYALVEDPLCLVCEDVYGTSRPKVVDLTGESSVNLEILADRGFVEVDWNLVGAATQTALTCEQAGIDTIRIAIATASVDVPCDDGPVPRGPFLEGPIDVQVTALSGGQTVEAKPSASVTVPDRSEAALLVHTFVRDGL